MLKKIAMLAFLLSAASQANAFSSTNISLYLAPKLSYIGMQAGQNSNEVLVPELGVGAGLTVNHLLYLGGELFANRQFLTIKNGSNNTSDLRPKYEWGGSVLPGIVFDPRALGYGRLGLVSARFADLNQIQTGVQAGIGIEVRLMPMFYLAGEYTFTRFRHLDGVDGTPFSDQYSVGITYRYPGFE